MKADKIHDQLSPVFVDWQQEYQCLKDDHQSLKINYENLEMEHAHVLQKLKIFHNALFGPKSEKMSAELREQLALAFNEAETFATPEQEEMAMAEAEEATEIKAHKRKKGRKPLPKDLPRQEIIYDLSESEKNCPCGCSLSKIGEERSEQLDYIPAKMQVLVHVRYKYACKSCEDTVRTAPVPAKPLPKANASAGLLAHILVSKYADHLPLYRQAQIFKRHDIDIADNTMCNWVIGCGNLLHPLVAALQKDIVASDYVCSDETPLKVLTSNKSTCYMWVHLNGERHRRAVVFSYHDSRRGECATDFLANFQGYHQSDAYSGYSPLHDNDKITWVACMAHARRKFIEITKVVKTLGIAHQVVGLIGKLYKVEREAIDKELQPAAIKALRLEKAQPILLELEKILREVQPKTPPKGKLAEAINYTLNHWAALTAYLKDGRLRLDNNDGERLIRPFAIGRKNWLFSGTTRGATASGVIYSLVETCKANKMEPYAYLRYVLTKIRHDMSPDELRTLLPYNIDKNLLSS